jgi:hypothetical protein
MPLLHYELYQALPSIDVLKALLMKRPDTALRDACGLSALQVKIK